MHDRGAIALLAKEIGCISGARPGNCHFDPNFGHLCCQRRKHLEDLGQILPHQYEDKPMHDRNIDATRAGQTAEEARPSTKAIVHPPMRVADALAYADGIGWKHFKAKGDLAVITLAAEVRRIRELMAHAVVAAGADNADAHNHHAEPAGGQ